MRALYIFLLSFYHVYAQLPLVHTTQGWVRGLEAEDGDYNMFLGIPFGLVERSNPFGPAVPHPEFEDTFYAVDDSAICPQFNNNQFIGSIDCLHMNIFVPRSASPQNLLPVIAFIHGGAFERGFFGRYTFGPKFLVRHDVILVTFNYRLGPYGYMCTDNPRVPGNQASRDQLLALRWINENIVNFGGDPERVTLAGNSAGGMSADLLILQEGPKVFQQVIIQSGVSFFPSFPATVRDSPLILSQHFGFETGNIDEALDFIATVDPYQILAAWMQLGFGFRPCIEKEFEGVEPFLTANWVTKDVVAAAKDLNIIIGFNENEAFGLFLTPYSDLTNIVNDSLNSTFAIEHQDFDGIPEIRQFFFGDEELDEAQFKNAIDLRSDTSFVHTSIRTVRRLLKSDVKKLFLYYFSYDGERNLVKRNFNTTIPGAAHGDENGYLFDVSYFDVPSVKDQLIIDRVTQLWSNFVKFGDPTPQPTELVPLKWEQITPTSPYHYIHIDSDLTTSTSILHERIAFWDVFLEVNEHLQRFVLDNERTEKT